MSLHVGIMDANEHYFQYFLKDTETFLLLPVLIVTPNKN